MTLHTYWGYFLLIIRGVVSELLAGRRRPPPPSERFWSDCQHHKLRTSLQHQQRARQAAAATRGSCAALRVTRELAWNEWPAFSAKPPIFDDPWSSLVLPPLDSKLTFMVGSSSTHWTSPTPSSSARRAQPSPSPCLPIQYNNNFRAAESCPRRGCSSLRLTLCAKCSCPPAAANPL